MGAARQSTRPARVSPIRREQLADYIEALATMDAAEASAVFWHDAPRRIIDRAAGRVTDAQVRLEGAARELPPDLRAALDAWLGSAP